MKKIDVKVSYDIAEKFLTKCYTLNDILYVKHIKYDAFVYPGFNFRSSTLTEYQLKSAGAKEVNEMLYFNQKNGKKI